MGKGSRLGLNYIFGIKTYSHRERRCGPIEHLADVETTTSLTANQARGWEASITYHLVQQDVDVGCSKCTHEVLSADALAPVTTSTTRETISQPQRYVVVAGGTAGAGPVVIILVEKATTPRVALGDASAVLGGVDIET